MADSTVVGNNKAVAFRGKPEREYMPMESKAQNAAMHAAAEGKSSIGIPQSVGKKFVAESHGQDIKKLSKHKRRKINRAARKGLVSPKAAAKVGY